MSPTSKKIVGGALALLFVVTIVQSQAIMKIAKTSNVNSSASVEDQEAQVLGMASANCLQALPPSDNRISFIDAGAEGPQQQLSIHDYIIGVKLKNRCAYPITVIQESIGKSNGESGTHSNAVLTVKVEKFPNLDNPYETNGSYYFNGPMATENGNDEPYVGQSADITLTQTSFSGVPSPLASGAVGNIWATTIPAGGMRDYIYNGVIGNNSADVPTIEYVRASLNKVRWFKTTSFTNDSVLTNGEVYTFTFPTDTFITSYAKLRGCTGAFVYDKNGTPIGCE